MQSCGKFWLFVVFTLASSLSAAQQAENGAVAPAAAVELPGAAALTLDAVTTQRQAVTGNTAIEESVRTRAGELYNVALEHLRAQARFEQQARALEELRRESPRLVELLQEDLSQPLGEPETLQAEQFTLNDLEQKLITAEAEYATEQQEAEELEREPQLLTERRRAIPELQARVRAQLQEAREALSAPPSAENPAIAAAQQAVAQAQVQHYTAELAAYEQELLSFEARNNLIPHRLDKARREATYAERRLRSIRDAVAQRRQMDAQEQALAAAEEARRARDEMWGAPPAVRDYLVSLAEANALLADERTAPEGVMRRLERVSRELEILTREVTELRTEYEKIQSRIRAGGLNESVGVLLRRYKSELPSTRVYNQQIRDNVADIAQTDLTVIELRERRSALPDPEEKVREVLDQLPEEDYTADQRDAVAADLRSKLQSQRRQLQELMAEHQRFSEQVSVMVARQQEMVDLAREFREYINANILWSGGAQPFEFSDLRRILQAFQWLGAPDNWEELHAPLITDLYYNLLLYFFATLVLAGLFVMKFKTRSRIKPLGEQARKKWHTRYRETPLTLLYTTLQAAPVALLLGFLAWRVSVGAQGSIFAGALSAGLLAVALGWLVLDFLRNMFLPMGLVEAHFEWTVSKLQGVRHYFNVLGLIGLPLVFLVFCVEYQPEEAWKTSLGRVSFVALMAVVVIVPFPLLRSLFRAMIDEESGTWLAEHRGARGMLMALCGGIPALLGAVAFTGFYYTALQLSIRFFATFAFVMGVLVLAEVVRRWFVIAQRRLAMEQVRRRREAAKSDDDGPSEQEVMDQELDLVRIDEQTQRLMRSITALALIFGMYFIWQEILPALNVLNRIELWTTTVEIEQVVTAEDGSEAVETVVRKQPVTAANMAFALIVGLLALAAIKNLPSMVEIVLLSRMQLGSGERYATLAVMRYILFAIGAFFVFRAMGIGWSNVQWLVAAVGLGLGFGLQEIFANFVSGLILLFERPVRVGDIVTIGDKSGVVSKIRIRATTVTNFDKKELVIPNKELITGQVTNWTLLDNMLRLQLQVGVAYGSDTQFVFDTLHQILEDHPDVLKEPKPVVVFSEFGDSSLKFDVYLHVRVENGLRVRTEVNMRIANTFREKNIEIPFPQRDLHLRSGLDQLRALIPPEQASVPAPPNLPDIT